jgi:LacI family transcriptional regulator
MRDRPTLTNSFASRLRHEIIAGRHAADRPIPSERALAKQYGISRVTARRSLRQLCEERIIEVRPGRGYFVVPGAGEWNKAGGARAVLFIQRGTAGLPTLDLMHTRIANGALAEAHELGLELYIVCQEPAGFRSTLNEQWGARLRGVLLDWPRPDLARLLKEEDVPFVLVETDMEGLGVSCVIQDNVGGILSGLDHLAAHGHRRIGIIVGGTESVHVQQRLAGYREFFLRSGLPARPEWIVETDFDAEGGGRALGALLDSREPPTAAIVCHRQMVAGVAAELSARGLEYPRDLSLVVWGEPEPGEEGGEVTDLTHLAWSKEEMGRLAMRTLEGRIESGQDERMVLRIATELVDCGSVATPGEGTR